MQELREAIAERWPDLDAGTLAYAVRNQLPTLQATPRGLWGRSGAVRLTTLQAWTGLEPATDPDPSAAILRYLRAFGPASVADAAAWSRLTGLREPFERLRPRLRTFRDERGRELFDVPDAPILTGDEPAPVRLLPDYDNALLEPRGPVADRAPARLAGARRQRDGARLPRRRVRRGHLEAGRQGGIDRDRAAAADGPLGPRTGRRSRRRRPRCSALIAPGADPGALRWLDRA